MTLLRKVLGSLARVWLGVLAGWFVRKGYFDAKDAGAYVEGAADWLVPAVLTAVPSVWAVVAAKVRARKEQRLCRMVVRAAAAPAGTPIATIEHAEKVGIPIVVVAREVRVGTPADGSEAA